MDSRDSVIMGGFAIAGVFLISHGYLRLVWNSIYNATHGTSGATVQSALQKASIAQAGATPGTTSTSVNGQTGVRAVGK